MENSITNYKLQSLIDVIDNESWIQFPLTTTFISWTT